MQLAPANDLLAHAARREVIYLLVPVCLYSKPFIERFWTFCCADMQFGAYGLRLPFSWLADDRGQTLEICRHSSWHARVFLLVYSIAANEWRYREFMEGVHDESAE